MKALYTLFAAGLVLLFYSFVIQVKQRKIILSEKDKSEMILIPAGEFNFGLTSEQKSQLEAKYKKSSIEGFFLKGKKVDCKSFYIDKYEITNAQFILFIKTTGYKPKSKSYNLKQAYRNLRQPVNNIGWADAKAYAAWTGKRLPTEEEWEKAAKGVESFLWPWGNKDVGQNYNGSNLGKYEPVNVGSYPAGKSPYGIMDMAGNVYEMTTGRWYKQPCMKGGSFLNKGIYTMCAFRWAADDTVSGANWLGFRCVMDVTK